MIRASFGKTAAGRLLLGAGALALLIPAIAGCEAGDDAPTLQFHAASSGAQTVVNGIRITNMFVLGAPSGSTLPARLVGQPVPVALQRRRQLATRWRASRRPARPRASPCPAGTVAAPGERRARQPDRAAADGRAQQPGHAAARRVGYIPVTLQFQHAGPVTLQVPVEPQSYYWATYSPPASAPASRATPAATPGTTVAADRDRDRRARRRPDAPRSRALTPQWPAARPESGRRATVVTRALRPPGAQPADSNL